MRILVLTSSYPRFPGDGTAPFVQSICEHLARLGHDVKVVAPYDALAEPGGSTLHVQVHRFRYAPVRKWHVMGHARSLAEDMNFTAVTFPLLPLFLLAYLLTVLRIARRQRPEIIYAHWVLPSGMVGAWAARALHIPLAISLHGSDVFVSRRHRLLGWAARWVFSRASVVTACSEELRESAIGLGARPGRVHLIAWGADPVRFSPEAAPLPRADLDLPSEAKLLTALGRLVPKKGFAVLVGALPALAAACPEVHLLIGGDGPQREELTVLADRLGVKERLHLLGRLSWDQVPGFLAMGDLFVLPSVRDPAGNLDGLPTVLLEAMAIGKPVVASELGGVPLVVRDGVNGRLCRPGDVAELAQVLTGLLIDPVKRARLGRAGRISVETEFTWRKVAERLLDLFEEVK
jgi:phosphatidyl-myo-inositol dimannoside synthase